MPNTASNQPRRTLLLTGASRGIGHATVKRFSAAGWRVITCSRHPFPENCPWEAGPEDHIQVDLGDIANTSEAIAEIAGRCRGTPRIANRLLRRVRDYAEVDYDGRINQAVANDALNRMEVDTYGLDEMDRKFLTTIIEKFDGGPVGLGTISASIHEEKDSIEEIIEPDSLICACGGCLHCIGEDVSERLDIVPAQFRIIVTRRPKYACRSCTDGVAQAAAPARLIPGGMPTENMW